MEPVDTCRSSALEALLAENKENLKDPRDVSAQGDRDAIIDAMNKRGFPMYEKFFD